MKNSKQLYFDMPDKTALGIEDYIITEYYNGQEVSYRKETNARAMTLAKKYKDLGYDSF